MNETNGTSNVEHQHQQRIDELQQNVLSLKEKLEEADYRRKNERLERIEKSIEKEKSYVSYSLGIIGLVFAVLAVLGYTSINKVISDGLSEEAKKLFAEQFSYVAARVNRKELDEKKKEISEAIAAMEKAVADNNKKVEVSINTQSKELKTINELRGNLENGVDQVSSKLEELDSIIASAKSSTESNEAAKSRIDINSNAQRIGDLNNSIESIKESIDGLTSKIVSANRQIKTNRDAIDKYVNANKPIFSSGWVGQHTDVSVDNKFVVSVGNVTSGIGLVSINIKEIQGAKWHSLNQGSAQYFAFNNNLYMLVVRASSATDEKVDFSIYNVPAQFMAQ